jgi:hypothetical protein
MVLTRSKFLYGSVDGPNVLNSVTWLKEARQVLSPSGNFILDDDYYRSSQTLKQVSMKYGPRHDLFNSDGTPSPSNNTAKFTLVGSVKERGTNFSPLGHSPPPVPVSVLLLVSS